MLQCPKCKWKAEGRFCSQCGTLKDQNPECHKCGKKCAVTDHFCSACGNKVSFAEPNNDINKSSQSVREKLNVIKQRRLDRCSMQGTDSCIKKQKKETYRMTFGWLKQMPNNKFKYVMPRQGGGARKMDVPKCATYDEILDIACDLFAIKSDGNYIGNYNGEPFSPDLTCQNIVKESNFEKLPRIYVVTKVSHTNCSLEDTLSGVTDVEDSSTPFPSPPKLTPQKKTTPGTENETIKAATEKEIPMPGTEEEITTPGTEKEITKAAIENETPMPESETVAVTMETVNDYVKTLVLEEEYNPDDPQNCESLVKNTPGCTPMYMKNTVVQYFIDVMKSHGKEYSVATTGWGQFILLPDEDIAYFFTMREELDLSTLTYVCPPVLYFLGLKGIPFQSISENVIQLDEERMGEYKELLEEMKGSFKSK